MKKMLLKSVVLLCIIPVLLTSCNVPSDADTTAPESNAQTSPGTDAPAETDGTTAAVTDPPTLRKTAKPNLLKRKAMSQDEMMIYGTATPGSVIRVRYSNGTVDENTMHGEYFYIRVKVDENSGDAYISAQAEGCSASDETFVDARTGEDNTGVFAGKTSRLFFTDTVPFHQGYIHVDDSMTEYVKYVLQDRVKKVRDLTGKDTEFVYLICTNPSTIYCDELFEGYSNKQNKTPTTEFVKAMADVDGVIVPDMRQILNQHRDEPIFFRTDTHWSELGAYYAYEALMTEVKKDHSDAVQRTLDQFKKVEVDCSAGDLASMLGINKGMNEKVTFVDANFEDPGVYYQAKREMGRRINVDVGEYPTKGINEGIEGPTAYFMGDSYGAFLLPYIGMSFSQVDLNDGALWNYTMDYEKIAAEKPDYIVFCYTERNISSDFSVILAE